MHISDGVLSPTIIATTSVLATGLVAYSIKGTKEKELPKIALMATVFCVGSLIHFRVGPSSVHLLLSGVIGVILGRRAPIALCAALLFQFFVMQFGGITTLGANILSTSIPAISVGYITRYFLKKGVNPLIVGGISGGISVAMTVCIVVIMLVESNLRFGIGPLSAAKTLAIGHVPVMIIEAFVTAFTLKYIMKTRPEIIMERR